MYLVQLEQPCSLVLQQLQSRIKHMSPVVGGPARSKSVPYTPSATDSSSISASSSVVALKVAFLVPEQLPAALVRELHATAVQVPHVLVFGAGCGMWPDEEMTLVSHSEAPLPVLWSQGHPSHDPTDQ